MASERNIEHVVVLHIAEDGSYDLKVWGDGRVCVLWVDEGCRDDRVYEQLPRENDGADLKALIGDSKIGHINDGRISEDQAQAIRAMHWRLSGGKLGAVDVPADPQEGA